MAKILVIDDDDQTRDVVKEILEIEGYDVIEAPDGEIGSRAFMENMPDLVILDIIMPNKGGLETIIKLRENHPDVKIFAMTGGGRVVKADFLSIAESIGAMRTFKKPFERKELVAAVKEALS